MAMLAAIRRASSRVSKSKAAAWRSPQIPWPQGPRFHLPQRPRIPWTISMAVPTSGETCSWRGAWDELPFEPVLNFVSTFGTGLVDCWCFGGSSAIADNDGPVKIDANDAMTMKRAELPCETSPALSTNSDGVDYRHFLGANPRSKNRLELLPRPIIISARWDTAARGGGQRRSCRGLDRAADWVQN